MTRQESLEKNYRSSLAANGYKENVPQRHKDTNESKGVGIVKKTVTIGVVLASLWWIYRACMTVWYDYRNVKNAMVEEGKK